MDLILKQKIKEAQEGNSCVLNELVLDNQGLVYSIARRFLNRGYELEDITQIGFIGFIKAVNKFDFSYNVSLSTFAVASIIGEIKRFLRDDGMIKVSRELKYLCVQIKNEKDKNENISVKELAKKLNVCEDEIIMALNSCFIPESLDYKIDEDGKAFLDTFVTKDNNEEKVIDNIILKKAMEKLEDREKRIIYLRYYKGLTQKQVAEIIKVSQVQVSRIEKNILEKMAKDFY